MGLKYLWDTNAVVHYLQKNLPDPQQKLMSSIINRYQPALSVITEIELLCWKTATETDTAIISNFISDSMVYQLTESIKWKTIEIRKKYRLKLPDAIIAASALANKHILISNNVADFNKIYQLRVIDPFKLSK